MSVKKKRINLFKNYKVLQTFVVYISLLLRYYYSDFSTPMRGLFPRIGSSFADQPRAENKQWRRCCPAIDNCSAYQVEMQRLHHCHSRENLNQRRENFIPSPAPSLPIVTFMNRRQTRCECNQVTTEIEQLETVESPDDYRSWDKLVYRPNTLCVSKANFQKNIWSPQN